ncbi:MAG: M3 family oligoendopeptidase [candidate division KSB1 bacterium]|nr:M3 family oligoendopeptidase [candidate division KSB1 bacterium]MDZ7274735.1 M3 family oligoendopeptidase [candidate division KSB1 bacterium]MDZ7285560.1 M3 family oligoendopeptidase [candidate division KSB1 bacterium]MDZ7298592.1 M3 family oligoendopeptidase [candidate division KSB1 bacterium]MDZ7306771.1 M3 family oligoendopeptidase [candidate division KSB1 bacterium]
MTSTSSPLQAAGIRWDLSDLYHGVDDPRLAETLRGARERAGIFHQNYHGKVAGGSLAAGALRAAIMELEEIQAMVLRAEAYAYLFFSADTANDAGKALYARCQEVQAEVQNLVLFFELELQQLAEPVFTALIAQPELADYRHYLTGLRLFQPYMLSEKEEQIINKKDLTGKQALVNFFTEYTASFTWQLEVEGQERTLTAEEMRHLLRHPDPELRERVKRAYDGRYGDNAVIFCNVFNALIKDHALESEMRGYPGPMAPAHLRNRVAAEIVDTMMAVTAAHYPLAQEYYTLKARLLKLPKTRGCDLVAPVVPQRTRLPFAEGRRLIVSAFEDFSPEIARLAEQMFTRRWIDAEVRPHKRGGAYCHGVIPQHHPYVLLSYNDDLDNVYTLAHELGHAVHDLLARRRQSLFNYHPPLVAAETASVFAEMLLTRKLLQEVGDREFRLTVLTGKLEDLFATIHTQNYYTLFELDAHRAGARERLSAAQLCELWVKRRQEMYGEAVAFLPEQKWYWSAIPHFIHTRFYCYAYTFGALLVLALFRRYEEEGAAFVPRYISLLEAGGSREPEALAAQMGFDLRRPAFWESGFAVMRTMLADLKTLLTESSGTPAP